VDLFFERDIVLSMSGEVPEFRSYLPPEVEQKDLKAMKYAYNKAEALKDDEGKLNSITMTRKIFEEYLYNAFVAGKTESLSHRIK
jgi:hypothetical protein